MREPQELPCGRKALAWARTLDQTHRKGAAMLTRTLTAVSRAATRATVSATPAAVWATPFMRSLSIDSECLPQICRANTKRA